MKNLIKTISVLVLLFSFTGGAFADVYYDVKVKTGNRKHAETDATIYLTIYGTKGRSRRYRLDTPNYNDHERGKTDRHTFRSPRSLGKIKYIVVKNSYDNKDGPGWFLDYMTIKNARGGKSLYFPCNKWLASDHKTTRFMYPGTRCH